MSETEKYDEAERHLEAQEDAAWIGGKKSTLRIRISFNHEHLWPQATLTAFKAFARSGQSIISRVGNASQTLRAEQRIQLAELGVHVVTKNGECSCGLVVEAETVNGTQLNEQDLRELVFKTSGHFDHITRSITDLFIVGELGPSEPQGYWLHKPGELIATTWHCIHCGSLGEAVRDRNDSSKFKQLKTADAHERKWAALNVSSKRWQALKAIELENWKANQKKEESR